MKKVPKNGLRVVEPANIADEAQLVLPMKEIREAIREGLLALSVSAGMLVIDQMLQQDVEHLCGPKGKWDRERSAYRHSDEPSSLPLGGRRVPVTKPRVRSVTGEEVPLPTWQAAKDADLLGEIAVSRILARVSCRRYAEDGLEPVGEAIEAVARGKGKSTVSRRFVALTGTRLAELLARPVPDGICIVFIDGLHIKGRAIIGAIGIDKGGVKHLLGIAEGATENETVVSDLIVDLRERGLCAKDGLLFVLDGAKALRSAVRRVFGNQALVHRCQVHKSRNVADYLPADQREFIARKMEAAWRDEDPVRGEEALKALARSLDRSYPGAGASLREGLSETFTISLLGLVPHEALWRTLRSTNPIEQAFSVCTTTHGNVKHWQSGDQAMRWVAAGLDQASKGWRRIRGYRQLPLLIAALKRHVQSIDQEVSDRVAA